MSNDEKPPKQKAVISRGEFGGPALNRRLIMWGSVAVVVVIAAIATGTYLNHQSKNKAELKTLQHRLALNLNDQDGNSDVVATSTLIIDGANKGTYKVDKKTLGDIYLDRANAYYALGDWKKSTADYAKAATLNSNDTLAGLQGQYYAGYKAGQRKELIPILQQLITATNKTTNPMASSSVTQYQAAITALQKGQELDL